MRASRRPPRVFLSYPHPELYQFVRNLVRKLRRRGYDVVSQDNAFPTGGDWQLVLGRTVRSCDAVIALISRATETARYQRIEIDIAFGKGTLVPIFVNRRRVPDYIRTTQGTFIKGEHEWKPVIQALEQFLRAAQVRPPKPQRKRAAASKSTAPVLQSRIARLDRKNVPWSRHIKRDPILGAMFDRVLRNWNACVQLPGNYRIAPTMVRHITNVFGYMDDLCFGPFVKPIEPDGIPTCPEQYLVATIAALAHNIALLNDLPFQRSGHMPRIGFSERYRQFVQRTEAAYEFLGHGLDRRGRQLLGTAMGLGFEMARDSAYWDDGTSRLDRSDAYLQAMARNLRRADIMDVSHRIVRDFVHQLFDHLDYEDGFTCFFLHTFLAGTPGVLEGCARLEGNRLIVPVAKFDGIGLAGKRDPILSVLPLAGRLVVRLTELALKKIDAERSGEANASLRVEPEDVPATMSTERETSLTWAYFALSLIEPLSDTEAANRAALLIPKLVEIIQQHDPKRPMAGSHTKTQTAALLKGIPRLRRRSHALRRVCESALEQRREADAWPA